ncbi:hypothetical protein [Saccharomonospora glauca]|jgi:hypothetical protein|uniref:Uncharacterized protein n=1 Tax=Saccharomonospora glauca K62 TaxID=928724 RepID=I1D301_9PSEU|nr:hypothetical protein [Saccharomonospora glauca]EIE99325.1 hypothetical protein SacglDRAFT_02432 [Saccharomonospora glauca K62]
MYLTIYLGLLHTSLTTLADAFREVSRGHGDEPDVAQLCRLLAGRTDRQAEALSPIVERYGEDREAEPERLYAVGLEHTRSGPVGLLRDLQDLHMLAGLTDMTWTVVGQAAQGLRDEDLLHVVDTWEPETARQLVWLRSRIKQAAPQALIAAR